MKKNSKSLILLLTLFLFLFANISADSTKLMPLKTINENKHNYHIWPNWAENKDSYLYEDKGKIYRVESLKNDLILVERYNQDFKVEKRKFIKKELEIWGGFHASKDFNYVFLGKKNKEEKDDVEVIRIIKYDKAWQKISHASIFGANTEEPFRAGSLRTAEYKDHLYVNTSHRMYKSKRDGLNHQANLLFSLDTNTMKIIDIEYSTRNTSVGYVSHSFNQFILIDGQQNIVSLDHGDAFPRTINLSKFPKKAKDGKFIASWGGNSPKNKNLSIKKIPGNTGDNYTGITVGGFQSTKDAYITAYTYKESKDKNPALYIANVDKDNLTDKSLVTKIIAENAQNPILKTINQLECYIIWNDIKTVNEKTKTLNFAKIDSKGNIGEITRVKDKSISDCQPIIYKGGLLWYSSNKSKLTFHHLKDKTLASYSTELNHPFTDLNDSNYKDHIIEAYHKNLVNGMTKDKFQEDSNSTRAAFSAILWRMAGRPKKEYKNIFKDIAKDKWYTDAVIWAHEEKIVKGASENSFMPDAQIKVEDIMLMLYRHAKSVSKDISFNENIEIQGSYSNYAKDGIKWTYDKLAPRINDFYITANKTAKRKELAVLMNLYYDFLNGDEK